MGDNGKPAPGFTVGTYTVESPDKEPKFIRHSPYKPDSWSDGAKRYAADQVIDELKRRSQTRSASGTGNTDAEVARDAGDPIPHRHPAEDDRDEDQILFSGTASKIAFSDRHVTDYVSWAQAAGHDPDEVHTLKKYQQQKGIGREHANYLADQLYIGGGDHDWRKQSEKGEGFHTWTTASKQPVRRDRPNRGSYVIPGLGCPHCNEKFYDEDERTQHIRGDHPGEYSGPTEDMAFAKNRAKHGTFVDAISRAYGSKQPSHKTFPLHCNVCGQTYHSGTPTSVAFNQHVESHYDQDQGIDPRDGFDYGPPDKPKYTASVTDGKIVGHCPGCDKPLRMHQTMHGDELHHLHNDHVRCTAVRKTADDALEEMNPVSDAVSGLKSLNQEKPGDTWEWDRQSKEAKWPKADLRNEQEAWSTGWQDRDAGRSHRGNEMPRESGDAYDKGWNWHAQTENATRIASVQDPMYWWKLNNIPFDFTAAGKTKNTPAYLHGWNHNIHRENNSNPYGPGSQEHADYEEGFAPGEAKDYDAGFWKRPANLQPQFFDPGLSSVSAREVIAGDYLGRPDATNPTGRGSDEYAARNWDAYTRQRPLQRAEDRNVNTPVLPAAPIKTRNINSPAPGQELRDDHLETTRPEDDDEEE